MSLDWSDNFSAGRWKRGIEHFVLGRLLAFEQEGDLAFGTVAGRSSRHRDHFVSARVAPDGSALETSCTCSAHGPCEHAAALLAAVEASRPSRRSHAALRDLVSAAGEPPETRRFGEWLAQMQRSATRTPSTDSEAPLLYVIKLPTSESGVPCGAVVEPMRLVETARARFAEPVELDRIVRDAAFSRPSWVSARDVSLWIEFRDLVRPGFSEQCRQLPATERGAALLDALIETGRCRLTAAEGPRLSGGAPRPAHWAWALEGDGFRLTLAFDDGGPGWVLPFHDPRYLDPQTGSCGGITLVGGPMPRGLPPRLSVYAARDLSPSLRDDLRKLGLPEPSVREVVDVPASAPVPVIRLSPDADEGATAALSFEYDGHRIPLADPGVSTSITLRGGTAFRITRSPADETAVVQRLAAVRLQGHPGRPRLTAPPEGGWPAALAEILALEGAGARVEFDPGFPYALVRSPTVSLQIRDDEEPGWLSIGLGIEIDGTLIDALPAVLRAIEQGRLATGHPDSKEGTTLLELDDGRLAAAPTARLAEILDVLVELHGHRAGPLRLPAAQGLRLAALRHLPWHGEGSRRLARTLRTLEARREVPLPRGLKAELRPYQRAGFTWLQTMRALGMGALLADDMGLGKTLQTLAHILKEKQAGQLRGKPALVVCPTSVVHNWAQEAARFAPMLRVLVLQGSNRSTRFAEIPAHHLVITSYALLRIDDALLEHAFHLVVLDEAQNIKNLEAKVTQTAKALRANHRVALTGTPVENHLGDLYSILDFTTPGVLGAPEEFARHYRRPIERQDDGPRMKSLATRVAPLILRRTKAQVLTELPPKTEVVVYAELEGRQRDLYETVRLSMEDRVRSALASRGFAQSQIVFLDALLKLRQVCCDPRLVKLPAAARVRESAKLQALLDLLAQLLDAGRRVIVFSQFTSMLSLIASRLEDAGIGHLQLTGRTRDRAAVVDAFARGEAPVFLVSLKAGGSGLNLTHADTVIHYDPWWNPAVEDQASDRVHRLGQTEKVTIFKLVCRGSVEERILGLHADKRRLALGAQGRAIDRGGRLDIEAFEALLQPLDD